MFRISRLHCFGGSLPVVTAVNSVKHVLSAVDVKMIPKNLFQVLKSSTHLSPPEQNFNFNVDNNQLDRLEGLKTRHLISRGVLK